MSDVVNLPHISSQINFMQEMENPINYMHLSRQSCTVTPNRFKSEASKAAVI